MATFSRFSKSPVPEDTELRPLSDQPIPYDHGHGKSQHQHPWIETYLRWGPLFGVGSLGLSFFCVIMALVILVWSSGHKVSDWKIQPPVYLSITTAASNTFIRFAFAEALPIAWWRLALRGSTIEALDKEWGTGKSIRQALTAGRSFGWAAAACIAATLLVFDGPLLQRASSVISAKPTNVMELNLRISPELPTGYSGLVLPNAVFTSQYANEVFEDWLDKKPILMNVTGCEGSCQAKIHAPGLAPTPNGCKIVKTPLNGNNISTWPQWNERRYILFVTYLGIEFPSNKTWFGPLIPSSSVPSTADVQIPSAESIVLYLGWANMEGNKGFFSSYQCFFQSAILEYDILVNGTTVSLDQSQKDWPVIALANNTRPCNHVTTQQNCTLNALMLETNPLFASNYLFKTQGAYANNTVTFAILEPQNLNEFALRHVESNPKIAVSFEATNPKDSIMPILNELMFRGGVRSVQEDLIDSTRRKIDPGLSLDQTVIGTEADVVSVFNSELKWWAGSSIIQILAIMLVAPLFWGWWRLGRHVSFSPIEMAKAFDAPLLREANSNAGAEGIVHQVGNLRTRYGVARREDSNGETEYDAGTTHFDDRLIFHAFNQVNPPRAGDSFIA